MLKLLKRNKKKSQRKSKKYKIKEEKGKYQRILSRTVCKKNLNKT